MKEIEELAKEFYASKLDLDLYVGINNVENNRHAVYLSFHTKPSGISINQKNS